ncbi:hypothetical protein ACFQ51_03340 [Streptomyces kaempferi]
MREETGNPTDPGRTGRPAADILYRFLTVERAHRESSRRAWSRPWGVSGSTRSWTVPANGSARSPAYGTAPTGW